MVGFKGPIYSGAIINIKVTDRDGSVSNTTLPTSSKIYPTFEEYWYEECNGNFPITIKADGTTSGISAAFRFVTTPVPGALPGGPNGQSYVVSAPNPINGMLPATSPYMSALFISAFADRHGGGIFDSDNCSRTSNYISGTLQQAISPTYIVETVPLEVEAPIFHETTKTHPIKVIGGIGYHGVGWDYYSSASSAVAGGFNVVLTSTDMHYFTLNDTVWMSGMSYTVDAITSLRQITIFSSISLSGPGTIYSMQGESDQTSSSDANVILNSNNENSDYNAFCYGNGLESYRIRDSFNDATMKYSIRASTVIDDYEQEEKFASLTYSGVYRGDSSINRLNEFNLSIANFKNLDKDYGSIQKIYARDSDLLVLHQDKITSVLFGKNLLVDALGGGQVASIPEVLGNQVPYDVDNGISNDPASFTVNSDKIYFTDAKRGVVIEMIGNQGIMEISSKGMRNSFRDLLTENLSTQKIGAYDPYYNMYTLTTNNTRNSLCALSINRPSLTIYYGISGYVLLFTISTYEAWTISLIDTGFGTNWLSINQTTGTGLQQVYANPSIAPAPILPRTIQIRVSYCGGLYKDFLLTQKVSSVVDDSNVILLT